MSNLIFLTLSLVLWSVVIIIWICVGRGLRKSGTDHYRSRVLLLAAIINTVLCSILVCLQGIVGLFKVVEANHFSPVHMVLVLFMFVWPVKSAWNFFTISRRLQRRFRLKRHRNERLKAQIASLAKIMNITPPAVLSSSLVKVPFVFGQSSSNPFLAVPDNWQDTKEPGRQVMLSHELAHIRNRDVGFLSWASAFLRDLWWFLLCIPVLTIVCALSSSGFWIQMMILYSVCLINLWLLFRIVIKIRELLADSTVTMLMNSGDINCAIANQSILPKDGLWTGIFQGKRQRPTDSIRAWLWDKALFGKRQFIWRVLLNIFGFSFSAHPSVSQRLRRLTGPDIARNKFPAKSTESLWAGISIGLMGVVIALGGFWSAKSLLGLQDDMEIVRWPYDLFFVGGPMAVGFVALLFVLPAWSSLTTITPSRKQMTSLLGRYAKGLIGACLTSPLVLVGGWAHIEIKMLLVLTVSWSVLALFFGLGANIVLMVLWTTIKYSPRNAMVDIIWAMYALGLGLIVVIGGVVAGFIIFLNGKILVGAGIVLGTLIGLLIFSLLFKDSSISGTDQYAIFVSGPLEYRLEGGDFRLLAPLTGSVGIVLVCCVPMIIVSRITYLLGNKIMPNPDNFVVLIALGIIGCGILLFLHRQWSKRLNTSKCHQIYTIHDSLKFLGKTSLPVEEKTSKVFATEAGSERSYQKGMTTQLLFELSNLTSDKIHAVPNRSKQAGEWISACETLAGFGLWPDSTARLCSTYHSLCILQKAGLLETCKVHRHILWLKGLQQQNGTFKGPYSKRSAWEDTFFAVASLKMLGSTLGPAQKEACLSWAKKTLIYEGVEKSRLDAVYYCLAIIDALGAPEVKITEFAGNWLSSKIQELLLTNISHNSENVRFALKARHILDKQGKFSSDTEQIGLLADRIKAALEAELAGL